MKTNLNKIWSGGLTLALLVGGPALAGRSVNESVEVGSKPTISIENIAGSVRIVGTSGSTVEITGTLGDDVEELAIEKSGSNLEISVELPNGNHKRNLDADAELEIMVPYGSELYVETVAASIEIINVNGSMAVESVAGKIEIDGVQGELSIESVAGSVTVTGADLQEASFESVAGNIHLSGELSNTGEFSFETVSGNVILEVQSDFSAEWEVGSFSGSIENNLGPAAERTSKYAPGQELYFTTGNGGAEVEIETLSGRIEINGN